MSWTITVNGHTYTDADMSGYGYTTQWPAMLSDAAADYSAKVSTMSGYLNTALGAAVAAAASQNAAAASAATAVSAPGTSATSTSSMTIGAGSHAITIQAGKSISLGAFISVARTSAPTINQWGIVTAYDSGTGALTFTVPDASAANGSGTFNDWTLSLSGGRGVPGTPGTAATPLINDSTFWMGM